MIETVADVVAALIGAGLAVFLAPLTVFVGLTVFHAGLRFAAGLLDVVGRARRWAR